MKKLNKPYKYIGGKLPISVELLYNSLLKIKEEKGALTPEIIAKEAMSNKKHPLHKCFTTNVQEAAEKQWVNEARYLIQHLLVFNPQTGEYSRAFISIMKDEDDKLTFNKFSKGENTFVNLEEVMTSPSLRNYALQRALRELEAFRRKYNDLVELASLFEVINETIDELQAEKA